MAGGYISFPVNSLVTEDVAKIRLEWTWHKAYGNVLSTETEVMHKEGEYEKGGFDHMPKGLRDMTKALVR